MKGPAVAQIACPLREAVSQAPFGGLAVWVVAATRAGGPLMLRSDVSPGLGLRLPLFEQRRRSDQDARRKRRAYNQKAHTPNVQLVEELEGKKAAARAMRSVARDPVVIAVTRLFWGQDLSDLPPMPERIPAREEGPAPSYSGVSQFYTYSGVGPPPPPGPPALEANSFLSAPEISLWAGAA